MTKPNTETVSETPRTDTYIQIIDGGAEYASLNTMIALSRKFERENAELRAKLADRDSGWYAAERGEPRDESKGVEWLNGWENWAVLEERDALRTQLAQAQNEALERAAKVSDKYKHFITSNRIRALKSINSAEGGPK